MAFGNAFLVSFGLIFAAELGDKSQLVALWFATRYRALLVIAGVSVATLIVHLASVAIGVAFEEVLPERAFLTIVGLSFFVFAAWGIRGDRIDEESGIARELPLFGAFGIVTFSFFVSELGDKTQLATISLAGDRQAAGVWLGSTAGMVTADALAIFAGRALGKRMPQRAIAYGAATLFVVAGGITLWQAWW